MYNEIHIALDFRLNPNILLRANYTRQGIAVLVRVYLIQSVIGRAIVPRKTAKHQEYFIRVATFVDKICSDTLSTITFLLNKFNNLPIH